MCTRAKEKEVLESLSVGEQKTRAFFTEAGST